MGEKPRRAEQSSREVERRRRSGQCRALSRLSLVPHLAGSNVASCVAVPDSPPVTHRRGDILDRLTHYRLTLDGVSPAGLHRREQWRFCKE